MNKEQLHNYLHRQFDQDSLEELEKLVATYPYFQGARILLSKVSSDQGHHAFESHLNKAAIHSGSRVALFNEVMSERIQLKVAAIEREIEALEQDTVKQTDAIPVQELPVIEVSSELSNVSATDELAGEQELEMPLELVEEGERQEKEKEELLSELMVATGGDERSDEFSSESSKEDEIEGAEQALTLNELDLVNDEVEEEVNAKEDVERFNSMDELSQGVLIGAISRSLELEVTPDQTIAKGREEEKRDEEATGFDDFEASSSVSEFTKWVYQRALEMNYVALSEEQEPKADLSVEDLKGKDKSELIDRFIAFEPKITRGKAAEFSTPEQAAEALLEDDTWVTETLAAIYARQGNISKAKKAYKLLSLKFPEKSIYFANQIKKLGSQPNTKK